MIKIVRVGFGIVSQGLAEIILSTNRQLPIPEQTEVQTVGIIELMKGSKIDAQGINMQEVLKNAEKGDDSLLMDTVIDVTKTIQEINADIVIEASFTDIKTGQPAIAHIEAALKSNKHVVTTNKWPFALAFKQIFNLAKEKSKTVAVEGTVISGTPIINVLNRAFRGKNKCC
jgi:homoserine dehydrogenase